MAQQINPEFCTPDVWIDSLWPSMVIFSPPIPTPRNPWQGPRVLSHTNGDRHPDPNPICPKEGGPVEQSNRNCLGGSDSLLGFLGAPSPLSIEVHDPESEPRFVINVGTICDALIAI